MRRTIVAIALLFGFPAGLVVGRVFYSAFLDPVHLPKPGSNSAVFRGPELPSPQPEPASTPPASRPPKAVPADDAGKDWLPEPRTDLERRLESKDDDARREALDEVMAHHRGDPSFLPALARSWRVGRKSRFCDMTELGLLQSYPVLVMRETALPFLLEALRHSSDAEFAVKTLWLIGDGAVSIIPQLCHFADSDDARLRRDALSVLSRGRLASHLESRIDFFKPMLADPDPGIVVMAVDILGGYVPLDDLIKALKRFDGRRAVDSRVGGKIYMLEYAKKSRR